MSADARSRILTRVRRALAPLAERAAYPEYDDQTVVTLPAGVQLWDYFAEQLRVANARPMTRLDELIAFLREQHATLGYCDPALRSAVGEKLGAEFQVEYAFERHRADEYQFGITRAVGAIAESGTIVVNDASTSSRLASLAPWIHVAVLRPADLWTDIPAAIRKFGDDPNTIWITGPSKTADIEGILIEGVHGPGEQICLGLDY